MAEKKKILYIVEAMGGGVFTYIVDVLYVYYGKAVLKYSMALGCIAVVGVFAISRVKFRYKLINALTEREHQALMIWCLGVYVVLPSFAKASVVFNYVTWFTVLYIIASYMRLMLRDCWMNRRNS